MSKPLITVITAIRHVNAAQVTFSVAFIFLFPFFFFLKPISGVDVNDVLTPSNKNVIDCFSTDFSKTESKENNLYTHLVEFRKHGYKTPTASPVHSTEPPNKTKVWFCFEVSHFRRLLYPVFSQKIIRQK